MTYIPEGDLVDPLTTEEEVDGEQTLPLGLALHVADDQADHDDIPDY
jgi:hypothetical protein